MFNTRAPVIFGGGDSQELAARICSFLDVPLGRAVTKPFPNGECFIKIEDDIRQRDVFVVLSLCRPNVNDKCMELFLWGDALRRASSHRVTAVIPHFGYARQDRKSEGRTPISARLLCDLIESSGFDRVLTMDLHAPQIQGFFSRVLLDHLNSGEIFATHVTGLVNNGLKDLVALSPDIGHMKKLGKYRQGFPKEVGVAVIDKRRHPDGTVTSSSIIGDIEGKNIIMCDDIISTAGTMRSAIDFALANGAASKEGQGFYILATHGEFVADAALNLSHPKIKKIWVTDTIPLTTEDYRNEELNNLPISTLSVSTLFGRAIRRIHDGQSISALLGKYG